MSEFDKEAEREKLRERFEREERDRESTQRMSELLLKGATMTNKHCDRCGDPVFRQNGQEFCPTCQGAGDDGSAEPVDEGSEAEGRTDDADRAERPAQTDVDDRADGSSQTDPVQSAPDRTATRTAPDDRSKVTDATSDRRPVRSVDRIAPTEESSHPPVPTSDSSVAESRDRPTDDAAAGTTTIADAEAALTEALVRFSRLGATADDPRRASEHLHAARDAAEALAALRK